MSQQITFYAIKDSPFSTKVEIALQEAGVEAVKYEITPGNIPPWYIENVNPLGKVPAISYGPQHPPEQPGPESAKIIESLIIIDFISDLYPNAKLLPSDPVQKAQARVFASLIDSAVITPLQNCCFAGTSDMSELFEMLDVVQSQLPGDCVQYAVGNEFTVADISAAPFLIMLEIMLKNDIGMYKAGEGLKAYEVYNSSKYDRIRRYVMKLQERPSVRKCIDSDLLKEALERRCRRIT